MGFGIGLIFTFLFWHLQDYGGSPTLFGVASVINHISEIFAYFFSFRLITQIGHVKVSHWWGGQVTRDSTLCHCRYYVWDWLEIFCDSCTSPTWRIHGMFCHSNSCKALRMPPSGQPAVHTSHIIRHNIFGPRLRAYCKDSITVNIYYTRLNGNHLNSCFESLSIGLGRGCGAVIGGFFVRYLGTATTFRAYGEPSTLYLIC